MYYTAHGTFIGSIRLEQHKPQQLLVDAMFRFGASTRSYVLRLVQSLVVIIIMLSCDCHVIREKPQTISLVNDETTGDNEIGMLLGLTDLDHEVDVSHMIIT